MVQRIEIYSFECNKRMNKFLVVFHSHPRIWILFQDDIAENPTHDIDGRTMYKIVCTIEQRAYINNACQSTRFVSDVFVLFASVNDVGYVTRSPIE